MDALCLQNCIRLNCTKISNVISTKYGYYNMLHGISGNAINKPFSS